MNIRDRIKELRRVRAGDLRPHPKNWRTHPEEQQMLGLASIHVARAADEDRLREPSSRRVNRPAAKRPDMPRTQRGRVELSLLLGDSRDRS